MSTPDIPVTNYGHQVFSYRGNIPSQTDGITFLIDVDPGDGTRYDYDASDLGTLAEMIHGAYKQWREHLVASHPDITYGEVHARINWCEREQYQFPVDE